RAEEPRPGREAAGVHAGRRAAACAGAGRRRRAGPGRPGRRRRGHRRRLQARGLRGPTLTDDFEREETAGAQGETPAVDRDQAFEADILRDELRLVQERLEKLQSEADEA